MHVYYAYPVPFIIGLDSYIYFIHCTTFASQEELHGGALSESQKDRTYVLPPPRGPFGNLVPMRCEEDMSAAKRT